MTLNLLRNSWTNPKLSTCAAIFGIHEFNRCPLSTPGTKVIVDDNTDNRQSLSPHGTDGWYIGLSIEHYICVQYFMSFASSVCKVDTLTLLSAAIPPQKTETEDYLG